MWVAKDSSSADSVDSKIIPLKSISTNILTVSCCHVIETVSWVNYVVDVFRIHVDL